MYRKRGDIFMAKRENGKTVAVYLSNDSVKELEELRCSYIETFGIDTSISRLVSVCIHCIYVVMKRTGTFTTIITGFDSVRPQRSNITK